MQLELTLCELAQVMQAKLISQTPDEVVTAFVTDSRKVVAGSAFIALKGQQYDARCFIPEVLQKGARVIVAQEEGGTFPQTPGVSWLLVKDPLRALQNLARFHRLHSSLKVAAITGSNGKSTTKQMLCAICQTAGETIANTGNFNNQFGVPFSLLEILPKHRFGVFELGASHPGDIEETARLAVPDVAVITNVSAAHLEFFHDLETVYRTKTEIARCLREGGTLVYNADDTYLSRLHTEFSGPKISFGFCEQADVRVQETDLFAFTYRGKHCQTQLRLERHDKLNAAAAASAALALGLAFSSIAEGLSHFTPMPMRLERITKKGVHFLLDCYNANPASMKNALEILGREKITPRVAVVGDMKELGENSPEYHRQVARQILDNNIETAFLAGPNMQPAYEVLRAVAGMQVYYAAEPAGWMDSLRQTLAQGGSCLVKASRSMHFERVFDEF